MPLLAAPQQVPSQSADDDSTNPRETTYSDPAEAIFSMYITRVQKYEDEKNVENWKGGAEGILVFVCFCTVSATTMSYSYKPPRSHFLDRPLLCHGGYLHCPQLSELAARSQRHYPFPPCTDIPTTFHHQYQRYYSRRESVYRKSILPSHVGDIHQRSLVP